MATNDEIRAKDIVPELTDFRDDTDGLFGDGNQSSFFMKALSLAKSILGRIHLLPTTITAFRTGDVIPVDGPSGTAKMSKDDLLKETAENCLNSVNNSISFTDSGSLTTTKHVYKGPVAVGTKITISFVTDKRVNLYAFVNGASSILISSKTSGTAEYTIPAGFEFIGLFAYDGETQYTLNVIGSTIRDVKKDVDAIKENAPIGFIGSGTLTSNNYKIFTGYAKSGTIVNVQVETDERVNVVALVSGSASILYNGVKSVTFDYTIPEGFEGIGFFVYEASTQYKMVVTSATETVLTKAVDALPILTRKIGTTSSSNYNVYTGPVKVGDVITLDLTASKRVNLFALVNGTTSVIINGKTSGTAQYTIPAGFQSIGVFAYDGSTNYVLDVVTGIGGTIVANKNTLKNITSTKLTSNLLNGFCQQEDFTLMDMRDVDSYVKGLQGSVSTIHDIEGDYTRISVPSGASISSTYKQVTIKDVYTKYDVNGKAEVYFSADMKNTENFIGLFVLTNNIWSSPNTRLRNVSDSFGSVTTHIVVSGGTPGASVRFTLKAFFSLNTTLTLDSDLTADIKNAILSLTPINEIGSYENVNNRKSTFGKNLLILGDSISTGSYYSKYLPSLLQLNKMYNVAVSSATICDRSTTSGYDGNPTSSVASGNVLGNQVQKVINNPSDYTDVDIILISAGTNDGTPTAEENTTDGVESFFTSDDGASVVNCTTPTFDSSDTYQTSRKHFAGALRYVVSRLEVLYPNAKIFLSTPIQGGIESRKTPIIQLKQQIVNKIAERLSVNVLHTGECCGILQDFEYGGYYWDSSQATESHPKNGRDLIDALHPNEKGSKKMAEYIANKIESACR